MKAKSILANATIIIIALCVFLNGYVMSFEVPSYADTTADAWTQVTTNQQLVEAFRYYCKSRDVTINGGVADAVTHFTTKTFNGICNTLGIDVTALQAQLKYQTDGNIGNRFLFTALGIDAYNRIFAQFLQDNNLAVGDENIDKTVASGRFYSGISGSGWVYIVRTNSSSDNTCTVSAYGTAIKYERDYLRTVGNSVSIELTNSTITGTVRGSNETLSGDSVYLTRVALSNNYTLTTGLRNRTNGSPWNQNQYVDICCFYDLRNSTLNIGSFTQSTDMRGTYTRRIAKSFEVIQEEQAPQTNVTINSTVINNNTYEGDTIINNNGTTGGDDPDPDPDPEPDDPNYNPYPDGGGTVTPPGNVGGNGSDGTINFPDFNINLPEINWSLGDLSQKFPFSIPFDMIAFLTLLNGEPQAPHITGTIPLTSHYTWNLDLDFSQFDTFAGIMRGLEFVGFMFFLISATINIVRG